MMAPVALLVSFCGFVMLHIAPGDPVLIYAGEERDPVSLAQIRHSLGLDEPVPVQYVAWLGRVIHGDLGRSIRTRQPVSEAILERLPASLQLGCAAFLVSLTVSALVGTIAALRHNSMTDLLTTTFAIGIVC